MGKLAERLARRRGPHGHTARGLCHLAVEALSQDDDSELRSELEACFEELSASEMDELLDAAAEESELRSAGEDLDEAIQTAARILSEEVEDEGTRTVLFALPLVLKANQTGGFLDVMDLATCDAIGEVLQEQGLIDENCEVVLMPRLLAPQEADRMRLGDLYHYTRALDASEVERALSMQDEQRKLNGIEVPEPQEEPVRSGAVLMGIARGELHSVLFPLARAVTVERRQALEAADPGSRELVSALEELHDDLSAELERVAAAMQPQLGVTELEVCAPLADWGNVASMAAAIERGHVAAWELREIARKVTPEATEAPFTQFLVQTPVIGEYMLTFPITRRIDGAEVGRLEWEELFHESWRKSLHLFVHFMQRQGLEPQFELEDLEGDGVDGATETTRGPGSLH